MGVPDQESKRAPSRIGELRLVGAFIRPACAMTAPRLSKRTMERTVRFATTSRGVRVAWSQVGSGPVLLAPPGWVSHIGHLWDDPASRAYQEALAEGHTLVTFDRPGTGLSDLDRTDFSMEEDFAAMEAVIAAQGASRLSLLGTSQGCPI